MSAQVGQNQLYFMQKYYNISQVNTKTHMELGLVPVLKQSSLCATSNYTRQFPACGMPKFYFEKVMIA